MEDDHSSIDESILTMVMIALIPGLGELVIMMFAAIGLMALGGYIRTNMKTTRQDNREA
jgi:hypothetical protein